MGNTNKTIFPRNRYGNTMSSNYNTTKMFTIFSNLPSELRVKIWQQACSPRTVTLTYTTSTSSFTSTTPPPTLLSVSHEAREEALRIYTLSFGTPPPPRNGLRRNPPRFPATHPRSLKSTHPTPLRSYRSCKRRRQAPLGIIQQSRLPTQFQTPR